MQRPRRRKFFWRQSKIALRQKMNWKERFVTEETSFRKMKDGCSKKKKLWTRR